MRRKQPTSNKQVAMQQSGSPEPGRQLSGAIGALASFFLPDIRLILITAEISLVLLLQLTKSWTNPYLTKQKYKDLSADYSNIKTVANFGKKYQVISII